jgi:hypothetical protein
MEIKIFITYNMNDTKMDLQIEQIPTSFSSHAIDKIKIIKIQKWFRGYILRLHP